jgi:hypothetical protein
MFVSIVTAKGYLNKFNHSFQFHAFKLVFHNGHGNIHSMRFPRCKAAPTRHIGALSRALVLAFSYSVRVGTAHTDNEEYQSRIMLRNEVGYQPKHRRIDQQPIDEPETDAGIFAATTAARMSQCRSKKQCWMNCGELIQNTPAAMPRAMLSKRMIYPKNNPITEQTSPMKNPIVIIAPCVLPDNP